MARGATAPVKRKSPVFAIGLGLAATAAAAAIITRVVGDDAAKGVVTTSQVHKLGDGSTWVTAPGAKVTVLGERRVRVEGSVLLDVAPGKTKSIVETARGVRWPSVFVTAPAEQIALLIRKYRGREAGRIRLPRSAQELWAQHKYSVMARDPAVCRAIGRRVTRLPRGARLGPLADELVLILRADPPPAYIGMIGSRRRVRATYVQLVEEGFSMDLIDRIHAPVGLDVGAETPEEIAVAVAAELVLVRRGGTGVSLKGVERVAERYFGATQVDEKEMK